MVTTPSKMRCSSAAFSMAARVESRPIFRRVQPGALGQKMSLRHTFIPPSFCHLLSIYMRGAGQCCCFLFEGPVVK